MGDGRVQAGSVPPLRARLAAAPGFGTQAYREEAVTRALDSAVAGIRNLASVGGADDAAGSRDWSELVDAAVEGLRRSHTGERRLLFAAAYVAVGDHCRVAVDRVSPRGPQTPDPVVNEALGGPEPLTSTQLIRAALAAEVVGATSALRPVVEMYRMGALLSADAEQRPVLARESGRVPLEWTGSENVFTKAAPGRLRPPREVAQTL